MIINIIDPFSTHLAFESDSPAAIYPSRDYTAQQSHVSVRTESPRLLFAADRGLVEPSVPRVTYRAVLRWCDTLPSWSAERGLHPVGPAYLRIWNLAGRMQVAPSRQHLRFGSHLLLPHPPTSWRGLVEGWCQIRHRPSARSSLARPSGPRQTLPDPRRLCVSVAPGFSNREALAVVGFGGWRAQSGVR